MGFESKRAELKRRWYPETNFGGFADVDGTVRFYTRVNSLLTESATALDVGCGRGWYEADDVRLRRELRILKGKCMRVVGIDTDPSAEGNPYLDEFRLLSEGTRWPMEDESVDLCLCDYVVEHLEDPSSFFSEAHRVLKQNGVLCIRTPNLASYFGLIAKLVPNRLHLAVTQRVQTKAEVDSFPTYYRCNTRRALRRALSAGGFDAVVYGFESDPSYLGFSRFLYALGVIHQRYAPSLVKTNLFAFAKKS